MDGRDSMVTPGSSLASFYIQHRGIGGPGAGSPAGLHGAHPGFRHLDSGSGFSFPPSSHIGGSHLPGYQVETSPPASQHSTGAGAGAGAKGPPGPGQEEQVKRKRGRPRKYKPDGAVTLGLSPSSSTPPSSGSGMVTVAAASSSGMGPGPGSGSGSGAPSEKRGRGRPPGSGKMQQLASFGKWLLGSVGTGFTPHVIIISSGEDIAARIMSFSQQGPRAVCIISATGAVSTATLLQNASSGSVVTYEGRFEILCLSGSYLVTDDGGSRARSGGLCVALCGPDHRVIGGSVGGVLIAAGTVQVIVGSFMYGGSKKNKTKAEQESGDGEEPNGGNQEMATMMLPHQNVSPPSMSGGWPGLMRHLDSRSSNIDINSIRE